MIAADTSAIVAIIQEEPECEVFLELIRNADSVYFSAVSLLEAGMVLRSRRGPGAEAELAGIIDGMGIEIVPFDAPLARLALQAFERYGKGNHSKARLNLGDCAAYALAKSKNAPLLYKGTDFASTDIASAAP